MTVGLLITAQLGFKKDEGPVTWLDSYVMVSFLVLAATMVYNGIAVALVISAETDVIVVAGLTACWIFINVVYGALAVLHLAKRRKRLKAWEGATGFVVQTLSSLKATFKKS